MVLKDLPVTRRASDVPFLGLCCPALLTRSRASSHIVLRLGRISAGHGFVAKLATPAEFEGGIIAVPTLITGWYGQNLP
jgi:hypothetical protein